MSELQVKLYSALFKLFQSDISSHLNVFSALLCLGEYEILKKDGVRSNIYPNSECFPLKA